MQAAFPIMPVTRRPLIPIKTCRLYPTRLHGGPKYPTQALSQEATSGAGPCISKEGCKPPWVKGATRRGRGKKYPGLKAQY
jgi:hypothetical protein